MLQNFRLKYRFFGVLAPKKGYRNAPVTLTRYTPVRAVFYHRAYTFYAHRRVKFHVFKLATGYFAKRFVTKLRLVHSYEPLLRRAVDDRLMRPPAKRIRVREFRDMEQIFAQKLDYLLVSLENMHTHKAIYDIGP